MRRLTASQKIALLERRVANVEKQAIFGLFKSKEEKERARDIKNLQREVSRTDKMSLKQIKALKTAIEDLWIEPDYVKEHKEAIQSMIRVVEHTLKRKEKEEKDRPIRNLQREVSRADKMSLRQLEDLKDRIEELEYDPDYAEYEQALQSMIKDVEKIRENKAAKNILGEMMRAKSYPEFHKLDEESYKLGVYGFLRVNYRVVAEKEADLFVRYLLEPYDKNFKLNVRGDSDKKKGYATIRGHRYKIIYERPLFKHTRSEKLILRVGGETLWANFPFLNVDRDTLDFQMNRILKA